MRKSILTLIAASAVLVSAAQGWPAPKLPENGWTNIDYVGDGIEGHKLDIFVPDSTGGPYKPIIVIYGSAWFANNAKDAATFSLGRPLLDAGFAVVSVNHRSSGDAHYPAQINDIKAAIRYVRANADKYNLDPSFVGITGFSSGGHLSSLAGTTNRVGKYTVGDVTIDIEGDLGDYVGTSSDVDAVVDWFGPIDMRRMERCETVKGADSPEAALIGCAPADNLDMIDLLSPMTYIDTSDPKFLVIHGNSDSVVPYCQSVNFADKLEYYRLLDEFITVEGGEHGPVTFNDSTFRAMTEFFAKEAAKPHTVVAQGNPIFRNRFTADPAPMVYDGRLYLYAGHDEYYPGQDTAGGGKEFNITEWVCYSTDDMVNWTDHGAVLAPQDFAWSETGAAWASQVVERDGKFYYYVTTIGKEPYNGYNVGVAVADTPIGPFRDALGRPLVNDQMTSNGTRGWWNDIDPTVLIDGDDAWLCWGNGTCFIAKLKPNMIEIDGEIQTINVPRYVEGPWLSKHGDTYYLTYAAMGKGQESIEYATAPSIAGPWTPQGVLIDKAENSFTIHPGLIDYGGKSYVFYHNAMLELDGIKGATGRRAVCVDELIYNPDGTLSVKSIEQ